MEIRVDPKKLIDLKGGRINLNIIKVQHIKSCAGLFTGFVVNLLKWMICGEFVKMDAELLLCSIGLSMMSLNCHIRDAENSKFST